MIGGKTNSANRPSALGTMLNASTYGQTIPTIIGMTRSTLYPIWAANLRKGGSSKKGKKGKGPPTYVENVDFLIGSNPIEGVLQIWSNNTNRYNLNFVKTQSTGISFDAGGAFLTFASSDFYFLIGVTVNTDLYGTFNDYGDPSTATGVGTGAVNTGGTGYTIGDTFSVDGGDAPAIGRVVSLFGSAVAGFVIENGGQGYAVATGVATTTLTGAGSGLIVNILTLSKRSYAVQNSEYPLWNCAQHGPDLVNARAAEAWPYVIFWTPALGPKVYIPFYQDALAPTHGIPNGTGVFNIYYAALIPGHLPPITFNRMTFEPVLGDGTEYADAGLSAQQDLHPCCAGAGSSDIDLGSAGLLPDWRPEIKGSYVLHPHGDADPTDMIEDAFKSGQIQTGLQLGLIQRGVNCNDLPGPVQRNFFGQLEPRNPILRYNQPNTAGSILLAFYRWRFSFGTDPTIASLAGDVWNPIMLYPGAGFWWAQSVGFAAGNTVQGTFNGASFPYDSRAYIFEMDPGTNEVEATATAGGTTSSPGEHVECSITVTRPCYIMVGYDVGENPVNISPHWDDLAPQGLETIGGPHNVWKRYVSAAGTYTFGFDFLTSPAGWQIGMIALAGQPSPWPKALGNILDVDSLALTRTQCRAGGLVGSVNMNSQRKASEWLKEFLMLANAAFVWSGFVGKVIPRSEVSAVGNGSVYISPTASGPVATLTRHDIIGAPGKSPIVVKRKAQVDAQNVMQLEYISRDNDYNIAAASQPEAGAVANYGPRKKETISLHEAHDSAVARKILMVEDRRRTDLRNVYYFTATQKWVLLEAMDLIQIPDPNDFSVYIDVRLTKVAENDKMELVCEAEPFIYGTHALDELAITAIAPNNPDSGVVPALVNAPIFLEPPTEMTVNNAMELWIPVSNADENYGGCFVWISTDGVSYGDKPATTIFGGAVTGTLTSSWPAGLDPDTVNDLLLDLSESLGTLASYSLSDMNNFVYPFYVEGASTCGYELGAYATATLTGTHLYTLPASPNGIRRGIYHQPLGGPVSHSTGKRFAFLGAASVASSTPFGDSSGIAKLAMQPFWVGQTLYFKFQAFNALGGGVQDLADCVPYTYIPGGCAIIPAPDIVTIPVTSPAPGLFSVAHGLTYTPAFATVQMTSGGDIQVDTPLSVDGTNVYLNASDVGLTALVTLWANPADANVALAPSAGGNFTVPHGLAGTPTLEIVQMASSVPTPPMGDIWKQATPYTPTNLNLVAADGGIIGKAYAWLVAPTTVALPRFAKIPLTAPNAGNFTAAHGLAWTPRLVIVRMSDPGGRIWLQYPTFADTTDLFLTASDTGLVGEAEVWG